MIRFILSLFCFSSHAVPSPGYPHLLLLLKCLKNRVLMSHKEHHILRIWMDAPYATQKVKWGLDQVSCCGGMPGWEATSGPASHTVPVLRTEVWPTSPCLLGAPKNHRSLEDCCKQTSGRITHGEWRCTKLLWGLCSGPLTSTTWLGLQGCPAPETLTKNSDAEQNL